MTFFHLLLLLSWLLPSHLTPVGGLSIGTHYNIQCLEHERRALIQFKHGIDVDHCGLLSSWRDQEEHRDCCQWNGIRCSNRTGHVIMLNLRGIEPYDPNYGCLQGKVGPSLLELKHLKYLDLSLNNFQRQPIPEFLGSLITLKHLNLSNSGFSGEIPQQLGNLSNLTSIGVSCDFDYTGLYVQSLHWLSHLNLLKDINLNGVDLSKVTNWVRIVNNLSFLRVLRMDGTGLSPTIPSSLSYINSSSALRAVSLASNDFNDASIFKWLFNLSGINTHLVHVDFSENSIPGPIPSAFGNMHALSYLDLSFNQIEGLIPSTFGNLHALSYLDLSFNQLEGFFPKNLSNLCSLETLSLQSNNLMDEFSNIIHTLSRCKQKALKFLDLRHNRVWGSIPDPINTFSSLSVLALGDNQLNGTISESLGQLSLLEWLDLSLNSLKATLFTNHFSNLSRLSYLDLSNNPALVIDISPNWIPPFQLDEIRLSSCKVGPRFPKWLETQKNLSRLDLFNAQISDTIPHSFWKSLPSNMQYLNMSYNNIYGTLPNLPTILHDLPWIDLSSNYLKGVIPSFLRDATLVHLNNNMFSDLNPFLCSKTKSVLTSLDLSNNIFSQEIPDCWIYFDQLSILRLENNNFRGNIPASMGALKQLQALHLRNNSLSGKLPMSLQNCTTLVILDLTYNTLSGHIPKWVGNSLKSLGVLSLRSNNFLGDLPLSLCHMRYLQILDLSGNHISGTIPKCIYNLTAMTNTKNLLPTIFLQEGLFYYDAAWVMWKRKEWSFKNSLGLVKAIDISENELQGQIPDGISWLTGLIFLNLSRNNLSGSITLKIGELASLESLDLSNNHLSGEIPASLAKLSSLEILDLSNNNLSGKIPVGTQLQGFDASAIYGESQTLRGPTPKVSWRPCTTQRTEWKE